MKSVTVLLFVISGIISYGQNRDYVVIGTDTVYGMIRSQNFEQNPATINFRKSETEEWKQYSPMNVAAFRVYDAIFERQFVKTDWSSTKIDDLRSNSFQNIVRDSVLFLRVSYKSSLTTLYNFFDKGGRIHFYLRKGGGEISELIRKVVMAGSSMSYKNFYWQALSRSLGDCPQVNEKRIRSVDFTEGDLKRLLREYEVCMGGTVTAEPEKEEKKASISAYFGPGLTTLTTNGVTEPPNSKLAGFAGVSFPASFTLQAGVSFEFVPKLNPRWTLGGELGVRQYIAETQRTFAASATFTISQHYKVSPFYIRFSPNFRYYFSEKSIRPYLNFGLSINYAISFTAEYDQVQYSSGNPSGEIHDTSTSDNRKFEVGIFGGFGVKISKFDFMARYEHGTGVLIDFVSYSSSTQTLSLMVQYTLKK